MRYLIIFSLLFMGCAFTKSEGAKEVVLSTASIVETDTGVEFNTSRPVKMTMKKGEKGEVEYTYDSQTESLISKIVSIFILGLVGSRR